ncbi:MAG: hypothetical protein ACI4N3_05090 [Alphaproteobacteria bacterium]
MLKQEDVQKMANETYHGVEYTSEKKKSLLKKYNRRIALNNVFNVLLSGDIIAILALIDRNPDVAKKLIFAGAVLGVGSVVSVINSLRSVDKIKWDYSNER